MRPRWNGTWKDCKKICNFHVRNTRNQSLADCTICTKTTTTKILLRLEPCNGRLCCVTGCVASGFKRYLVRYLWHRNAARYGHRV
mmetsp:Transcript_38021/g.77713  ORF Transcript_38021/g.77713 Transcript_38021/m.77713 type:complete len:85 (-) Transcript_38021:2-256(-)